MRPSCAEHGRPDRGVVLRSGLTLAIEPMLTLGSEDTTTLGDGWTVVTADGSWPHISSTQWPSVRTGARVDAQARSRVRIMCSAHARACAIRVCNVDLPRAVSRARV